MGYCDLQVMRYVGMVFKLYQKSIVTSMSA